jgi:hypothetical protein
MFAMQAEEGRAASKSPHSTFGYFLSISQRGFSADIIQNSPVGKFSLKTEGTKTKAARCLFFLMSFPFLYILNSCNLLLLFTFCQVFLLVKETAEIESGMAKKSRWDQANIRQKLGLVWRNRKKISQIIQDSFYLPFFLLIILCMQAKRLHPIQMVET